MGRFSPLFMAIANENEPLVELLLRHGANIHGTCHVTEQKHSKLDPIYAAIAVQNVAILQLLIARGVDVNGVSHVDIEDKNWTVGPPFQSPQHIPFLLEESADADDPDADNHQKRRKTDEPQLQKTTGLELQIKFDNTYSRLPPKFAKVHLHAMTPLYFAVELNAIPIVNMLLDHGAHINSFCKINVRSNAINDSLLMTPLCRAMQKNKIHSSEMINLLIDRGAELDFKDADYHLGFRR